MVIRGLSLGLSLFIVSSAQAGAVVTLSICDPADHSVCAAQGAGPFTPGETVLISVRLSQTSGSEHFLRMAQFDLNNPANAVLNLSLPVLHNLDNIPLVQEEDVQFFSFQTKGFCLVDTDQCGRDHFIVDRLGLASPIPPGDGIISITFGSETELGEDSEDQLVLPVDPTDPLLIGIIAATIPDPASESAYLVDVLYAAEPTGALDRGGQLRYGFGGADPITALRAGTADLTGGTITLLVAEAEIDLQLVKSVDIATPDEGETVRFTVDLTNTSTTFDATGVEVQDRIPVGLTIDLASVTAPVGTSFSYDAGTRTATWDVGDLARSSGLQLKFSVTVDAGTGGATLTNVAEVTAANQTDVDSTPGNDVLAEDDQDEASVDVQVSVPEVEAISWTSLDPLGQRLDMINFATGFDRGVFVEPRFTGLSEIEIGFSGEIDPATAIAANVTITGCKADGSAVVVSPASISVVPAADGLSLTINISPALPGSDGASVPSRYSIALTGVTNTGGVAVTVGAERAAVAMLSDVDGNLEVDNGDVDLARFFRDNPVPPGDDFFFFQIRSDAFTDGAIDNGDVDTVRFARDEASLKSAIPLQNVCP